MDRPGVSPEEQDPTLQGLYQVFAELLVTKGLDIPDEDNNGFVEKRYFVVSLVGEQLGESQQYFKSILAAFTPRYVDADQRPQEELLCVIIELDKTHERTFLLSNDSIEVMDTSFLVGTPDLDKSMAAGEDDVKLLREAFVTVSSAVK